MPVDQLHLLQISWTLCKLFATDRQNHRLSNPYVGLIDVFDAPEAIRTTRARVVQDDKDLSANYVMPVSKINRRNEGTPSAVADLDEFKKNWSVFTEGFLSQLVDWNNVVAAGGAVLACLTPLDKDAKVSKRAIIKYYHSAAYPSSDVDLFLWGLNAEQAEVKINAIYEAVRDSVPWDVTCIRTKHTISIHSQYPYRSAIEYGSYCGHDASMQHRGLGRDSSFPSYEVRLVKYSGRAFEVYVPTLKREEIDPTAPSFACLGKVTAVCINDGTIFFFDQLQTNNISLHGLPQTLSELTLAVELVDK